MFGWLACVLHIKLASGSSTHDPQLLQPLLRATLWNYFFTFSFSPALFSLSLTSLFSYSRAKMLMSIYGIMDEHVLPHSDTLRAINALVFIMHWYQDQHCHVRDSEELIWRWGQVKHDVNLASHVRWFANLGWWDSYCFTGMEDIRTKSFCITQRQVALELLWIFIFVSCGVAVKETKDTERVGDSS